MGFSFEHIEYGWCFALLVPAFILWYVWEKRKGVILRKMVAQPRLLGILFKNFNPGKAKARLATFSLGLVAIVLSLMNPRVVDEKAKQPTEGVQVMFLVDVSNSMLANDVAPNRLEKARSFAIKLADRFGGSRMGLVAFAGEARLQMPPTSDLGALRQAFQTLGPSSVARQGSDIEAALNEAYRSLSANALAKKAVILISDGEALDGNATATARRLARSGMLIHVVGVGTERGATLSNPETGLPILDDNDQQVISRLDEGQLKSLASETGGKYLYLEDTEAAVNTMTGYLNGLEKLPLDNGDLVNYYSFAPWVLMVALVLLTWQWWWPWVAGPKAEKKKVALLAGACMAIFSLPLHGQNAKKEFDAGVTAYKSGNYKAAMEAFEKALRNEPSNAVAKFYLSLSEYRQKNYPQSAAGFSELGVAAPSQEISIASFNNAGLAFAQSNNLPQAVEMFKMALKLSPADMEIRKNLQKAIMDLKRQQPPPAENRQEPEPPMDKDEANQKLQVITDQERAAREKLKPRQSSQMNRRNW